MEKATDTAFPAALRGLGFSEMPLDVVASLADNLKVPLEKVPIPVVAAKSKVFMLKCRYFRLGCQRLHGRLCEAPVDDRKDLPRRRA